MRTAETSHQIIDIHETLAKLASLMEQMDNVRFDGSTHAEQQAASLRSKALYGEMQALGFKIAAGVLSDINRIANALEQIAESSKPSSLLNQPKPIG